MTTMPLAPEQISAIPTSAANEPGVRAVRPNWASVVSHLDPKYGGLSAAVPALASAVAGTGEKSVTVAGFCAVGENFRPAVGRNVIVEHYPIGRLASFLRGPQTKAFRATVIHSAGVHIHGLWQRSTSTAAHLARSQRKPYVISAHGMLESWALANKKWKKDIYAALFERRNLRGAACLHALTGAEARDYRNFGLTNPIAVIPNGVEVPLGVSPDAFLERFPALDGKSLILFLGRIHFKKGLDILADAWAKVAPRFPEAHLVVAGPDFENTQGRLQRQLEALSLSSRVTFTGMLQGNQKWSALAAADGFILPSYSEGLSVSVLEAMGMGLPVIVTEQCNLPEVEEQHCGWMIQPRAAEVESALISLLQLSLRDRQLLGQNGRRLIAERYTWPVVGRQMAEVYDWLEGGPIPATVQFHAEAGR